MYKLHTDSAQSPLSDVSCRRGLPLLRLSKKSGYLKQCVLWSLQIALTLVLLADHRLLDLSVLYLLLEGVYLWLRVNYIRKPIPSCSEDNTKKYYNNSDSKHSSVPGNQPTASSMCSSSSIKCACSPTPTC